MAKASFLARLGRSYTSATTPAYVDRLFVSWLLPTWLLFVWRTFVALYMFTTEFFFLGYDATHGRARAARRDFSYFTVLTYWGMAFYYAFAAAHTASYAAKGRAWLRVWPGWLRWLHSVLYTTIMVYPFIVTAVFWAALAADAFKSEFSTWSNISEHALNSVLAFCEIVLPMSDPLPWINLIPLIVILSCYLALAYLVQAVDNFYVYDFLNPKNGRGLVAGACIGILAASIVVFIVIRYLVLLRRWITETKLGMTKRLPPNTRYDGGENNIENPSTEIEQTALSPEKARHLL